MTPLLQIHEISKSYGGVHALTRVSMDIAKGEVHALCGENGAGKSTLIKILSGSVTPDEGQISFVAPNANSGTSGPLPLQLGSVRASESAGIAVIHQESVAFPHLSSYDNIFVGREPKKFAGLFLDRARMRSETRALLQRLGESEAFDPARPVGELSVAQRQMVGMARALSQDCRLLIMDEPTASLSERETRVLFNLIHQFRQSGVSILYVSHRLDEIFELSDRVTVFRDGKHVATGATEDLTKDALIKQMVGRELLAVDARPPESPGLRPGSAPILEVHNLSRTGVFQDISFKVNPGEIVGMAGLVGAGRSEVARCIFGADQHTEGSILIDGAPLKPNSIREAMKQGIAMVPEDRQHVGLVLPMSVGTNISLAVLRTLTTLGLSSSTKEKTLVAKMMQQLTVKAASQNIPAETLSGGNQQKLVIGKWLATNPRVLILDEPTRGVDVGAKAEVHKLIRELAGSGRAILLISSDLPEVLAMSDRILVMRAGRIAGELSRDQATQERVLESALGAQSGAAA